MTQKSKTAGKAAPKKKKEEKCEVCETIESTGVFAQKKKGSVTIKNLGRSTLVEEDLQHTEKTLTHIEPEELKDDNQPKLFYRNFVFKCQKCISEFEHEATIPIIEHKIICPVCKEEHVVRVVPVARHYELKMPKDLAAVKHSEKKKR